MQCQDYGHLSKKEFIGKLRKWAQVLSLSAVAAGGSPLLKGLDISQMLLNATSVLLECRAAGVAGGQPLRDADCCQGTEHQAQP